MKEEPKPDPEKIDVVRAYLKSEFPKSEIDDRWEFNRDAQSFRVNHEQQQFLITVSLEFFRDYPASAIETQLSRFRLADAMKQAGNRRVIVTTKGLRIEDQ